VPSQNVSQTLSKTGEKITTWVQPEIASKKAEKPKSKVHHNLVAMKNDFTLKRQLSEQKKELKKEAKLA